MSLFPETQQALAGVSGNMRRGSGLHPTGTMEVGTQGLYVGSENYNPVRHSPHDIDLLSPFELLTGQQQVSVVIPDKPLNMNVVIDATQRREVPSVTRTKLSLAEALNEAMDAAKPGINDRIYNYFITDHQPEPVLPVDYEVIEVADASEAQAEASQIAMSGLTFVISDFRRWQLDAEQDSLDDIVAIKANHPMERYVPANIGFVSLGGWLDVNTNRPKQLTKVNVDLEASHQATLVGLRGKGAVTASVTAAPRLPEGFDVEDTDQAIAAALQELN